MDDYLPEGLLGLDAEELELLRSGGDNTAVADTPDPTQYHDPSDIKLTLSAGTMGSRMGGGPGRLGATMIPRATRLGGSQGFDPHQPSEMNIIDLTSKKQTTIDLSKLSKEDFANACDANLSEDFGTVAAIAFHRLAKKQAADEQEYVEGNTGSSVLVPKMSAMNDEAPVGGYGSAYVVPKSTKGGRQLVQTRAAKPRGFRKIGTQPLTPANKPPGQTTLAFPKSASEAAMAQTLAETREVRRATFQKPVTRPEPEPEFEEEKWTGPVEPAYEVHFEVPGIYEMTARYHEVILEENFLVLVYDNAYPGSRFRPQPSEHPIFVNVAGDPRVLRCFVPGIQYTAGKDTTAAGHEHVLLLVDEVMDAYNQEPV